MLLFPCFPLTLFNLDCSIWCVIFGPCSSKIKRQPRPNAKSSSSLDAATPPSPPPPPPPPFQRRSTKIVVLGNGGVHAMEREGCSVSPVRKALCFKPPFSFFSSMTVKTRVFFVWSVHSKLLTCFGCAARYCIVSSTAFPHESSLRATPCMLTAA